MNESAEKIWHELCGRKSDCLWGHEVLSLGPSAHIHTELDLSILSLRIRFELPRYISHYCISSLPPLSRAAWYLTLAKKNISNENLKVRKALGRFTNDWGPLPS